MQTYTQTTFAHIQTYAVDVGPAVHHRVQAGVAYVCVDLEGDVSHAAVHSPAIQTEHMVFSSTDTDHTVAPAWLSGDVTSASQCHIRIHSQSHDEALVIEPAVVPEPMLAITPSISVTTTGVSESVAPLGGCRETRRQASQCRRDHASRMTHQRRRRPLMHQGLSFSLRYVHATVGPPLRHAPVQQRAQSP